MLPKQKDELLKVLKARFEKNMHRHKGVAWDDVTQKLAQNPKKLSSLFEMEDTGGEPDVIGFDKKKDVLVFVDFSMESPKGRRSICYDPQALESRKEHKPKHSAMGMAEAMGVAILTEEEYLELQQLEKVDTKTSSWIASPKSVRELGGAIFGDWRYGRVFFYHNGAESYYAGTGFRAKLVV